MDRYLESFIAYLSKIKHYSNYTIIGYEANIDMFLQFLDEYKIKDLNKVDDVLIRISNARKKRVEVQYI